MSARSDESAVSVRVARVPGFPALGYVEMRFLDLSISVLSVKKTSSPF